MRLLKLVLSIILCLCLLAGCGGAEDFTVFEIADNIKGLSDNQINWITLDKSKMSTYFSITADRVANFAGYINDAEEHFDIIAVFEFEDEETRNEIVSAIRSMTSQISESYRLANLTESTKINNKVIAETDNKIILCILDKQDKTTKYIKNDVGAKITN